MFRRLGIFVNGFTLEAASAVAGGDELDAFDGFDLVSSLVDKSLIIADANGDSVRCALGEAEAIEDVSPRLQLVLLNRRARLSMEAGDLDSAERALTRALEECRLARGRPMFEAMTVFQLARIEFRRRQYGRATDLMYEALALTRNCETNTERQYTLVDLGAVLAVRGAIEAAVGPDIEAIGLLARDPRNFAMTRAIELLAYIAVAKGDLDRSARLAGYADASLARIGYVRSYEALAVYERLTTRLHEHLEPAELARLTTEGASLSLEAALALARTLETTAGARPSGRDAAGEALGADAAHERKVDAANEGRADAVSRLADESPEAQHCQTQERKRSQEAAAHVARDETIDHCRLAKPTVMRSNGQ